MPRSTLLLVCFLQATTAFVLQPPQTRPNVACYSVIKSEEVDFDFDVGQGGVRLAETTAVVIEGSVKHAPGSAQALLKDLSRYNQLTAVSADQVQAALSQVGAAIVCQGQGKEEYKDPGETTVKQVTCAPMAAVRDALMGAGSAIKAKELAICFAGGNDLQVPEVLAATKEMVLDLDVPTRSSISFSSVAHSSLPLRQASVVVVAFSEVDEAKASTGGLIGAAKAIASGKLYLGNGQYWTTLEDDVNKDVA